MQIIRKTIDIYNRVLHFAMKGLWEPGQGWLRNFMIDIVRRVVLAVRLFFRERMQFRASALTYSSLLSVVPMLAILFAVAKGFGLSSFVEEVIRDNIAAKPELVDTLVGFANSYLAHTHSGLFLGVGLGGLLWTLFNLTSSIETTFNQIWQVETPRTLFRKVTDYTAVFFLMPVFVIISSGLSIFTYSAANELIPDIILLRPAMLSLARLVPFLIVCLFFSGLYAFMPNTHVKFRSALVAGIPTGIIFQLVQNLYIHSQIWLSGYNAIYGSFAALPLFMFMCQISWTICLFGATLSYVDQNLSTYYYGKEQIHTSRAEYDYLSLHVATIICQRFADALPPYSAEQLSQETKIHLRLTTNILSELCRIGMIMAVKDTENTAVYVPAHDIGQITPQAILLALDQQDYDENFSERSKEWQLYIGKRSRMFTNGFSDTPLHKLKDEDKDDGK